MTHSYVTGGKTPDTGSRTYTQIMREQMLKGEESEVKLLLNSRILFSFIISFFLFQFQLRKKILEKAKDGTLQQSRNGDSYKTVEPRKRGRWDQTIDEQFVPAKKTASEAATPTWGDVEVSCL